MSFFPGTESGEVGYQSLELTGELQLIFVQSKETTFHAVKPQKYSCQLWLYRNVEKNQLIKLHDSLSRQISYGAQSVLFLCDYKKFFSKNGTMN